MITWLLLHFLYERMSLLSSLWVEWHCHRDFLKKFSNFGYGIKTKCNLKKRFNAYILKFNCDTNGLSLRDFKECFSIKCKSAFSLGVNGMAFRYGNYDLPSKCSLMSVYLPMEKAAVFFLVKWISIWPTDFKREFYSQSVYFWGEEGWGNSPPNRPEMHIFRVRMTSFVLLLLRTLSLS